MEQPNIFNDCKTQEELMMKYNSMLKSIKLDDTERFKNLHEQYLKAHHRLLRQYNRERSDRPERSDRSERTGNQNPQRRNNIEVIKPTNISQPVESISEIIPQIWSNSFGMNPTTFHPSGFFSEFHNRIGQFISDTYRNFTKDDTDGEQNSYRFLNFYSSLDGNGQREFKSVSQNVRIKDGKKETTQIVKYLDENGNIVEERTHPDGTKTRSVKKAVQTITHQSDSSDGFNDGRYNRNYNSNFEHRNTGRTDGRHDNRYNYNQETRSYKYDGRPRAYVQHNK